MLITDGGTAALARIDALHTALTQIVLEGGDLDGIAGEVARALDVGVVFTSTDGRERASALPEGLREALAGHDLIDPTGRLRVERMDGERGHRRAPARSGRCGSPPGAPTWPGWSACEPTPRSRRPTSRPWSAPVRSRRC